MKLIKFIPFAAIVLTSLLPLENKAADAAPDDYTLKRTCRYSGVKYMKVENDTETASWGVWNSTYSQWEGQYMSYQNASTLFQNRCKGN